MASASRPSLVRLVTSVIIIACLVAGSTVYARLSPQASQAVTMINFRFTPQSIVVPLTTSVTWTNGGTFLHTATSDTGLFNTGDVAPGQSNSFNFTTAGTYPYYCVHHGAPGGVGMSGTIIVVPAVVWLPVAAVN